MEVRAYAQDKGITYFSYVEFMQKCTKIMDAGYSINEEMHDDEVACVVMRNSAKCMLAMWIEETQEYREF